MTTKAKIIEPKLKPSIGEKLLEAELRHVKKRARDALYKYGWHHAPCPAEKDVEKDCTCGLIAIISTFYE